MKLFVYSIASVVLSLITIYAVGILFNSLKWPLFNGWALAHGTGLMLFLILVPGYVMLLVWLLEKGTNNL